MHPSDSISVGCVHPLRVTNPRYRNLSPVGKNFAMREHDDYYITIPCGRCALCRKRRGAQWRLRLINEYLSCGESAFFLTFTFNDKTIHLSKDIATLVRRWRQNYQYHTGVAPRYFLIEDKGTQNGRIHLHGLLFAPTLSLNQFDKVHHCFWPYGYTKAQKVKSVKACSYVSGYVSGLHASDVDSEGMPTKHGKQMCKEARLFIPKTYVSKGLGKKYALSVGLSALQDSSGKLRVNPFYRVGGRCYVLPRYYQNLIFEEAVLHQMKQKYKEQTQQTLLNFADMPSELKYIVNGKRLDEYGREELFMQLITLYEDDGKVCGGDSFELVSNDGIIFESNIFNYQNESAIKQKSTH